MRAILHWLWRLGSPTSPVPLLALGALAMFAVQLSRPITDVDIFWQVKLGELTLQHGLPEHEPFLAGQEHEPLAAVAWLGQVVYAAARMIYGWPGLRIVDAVIWFGGFVVVARHCARKCGNDWPALIGLWVGWYAAIVHASLRPQSFAVLGFGLLIVLVRSELPAKRKLILGALLLVLWQNLHPSVVIAIGYLGAYAIADLVRRRGLGVNAVLTLFAVVATVLTPAGFGIFAISKYNEEISKFREITEWLPMWGGSWFGWRDYGREEAWLSFRLTLTLVPLATFFTRRVRLGDVIAVIGLTVLSLWMHRFVLMWAVAVIPLWADALAFRPPQVQTRTQPSRVRFIAKLSVVVIAMLMCMFSPTQFYNYYPFAATDALQASGLRGTIYCNYFWGGVLADADYKVSHDGRYYLFPKEDWILYDQTAAGKVPLDRVIERWRPVAFVLRKGYDDGLIALLRPRWRVLFDGEQDDQSIIFIR